MFVPIKPDESWSKRAFNLGILSVVLAVSLALAEGVLRGALALNATYNALYSMLEIWCFGVRNVADTMLEVAAIVFVGAKFFEARTVFSVGFDKLDPEKVAFKGPDENNFVWIGHRYGSKYEADVIAAALEERLKEGAA
jgi:hypothetical protein